MDFQKAWNLYQEHYAPLKALGYTPALKNIRKINNLLEISDEFDALLLDGFGVLNIGTTAIPKMPSILTTLKNAGKSIFVLTNGASLPSDVTALKYPKWGYPITPEFVLSSRDSVELALKSHIITENNGLWGVIGMPESQVERLPARCIYLSSDNESQLLSQVDGFLFLGAINWNQTRQINLINTLIHNPRPILVGNPDISAPLESSFTTEPGFFCLALEEITGVDVTRFGKPFPPMYDLAFQKMNKVQRLNGLKPLEKNRILMVGDTLHTDILGGNGAGMKTALMTDYGFLRGQNAHEKIMSSGITPDFVIGHY